MQQLRRRPPHCDTCCARQVGELAIKASTKIMMMGQREEVSTSLCTFCNIFYQSMRKLVVTLNAATAQIS